MTKIPIGAKIGVVLGILGGLAGLTAGIWADPVMGSIFAVIFIGIFGSVFFFVVRPIMKPMFEAARLMKSGEPATATILSLQDTGVTVNENPQIKMTLEVRRKGYPKYQAEAKSIISRLQTSMYQPGMEVSVMVDQADPMKVAVVGSGAAGTASQEGLQKMLMDIDAMNQQIIATGTSAKAKILQCTPLGINVNGNNPFVQLLLEVTPEGSAKFQATAKAAIMESSIPKYQPGCEVYVKYDPNDLTRVSVEHS